MAKCSVRSPLYKILRIHMEEDTPWYEVYDRDSGKTKYTDRPFEILNPPRLKRIGWCPIDSYDFTLEFEEPIDASQLRDSDTSKPLKLRDEKPDEDDEEF